MSEQIAIKLRNVSKVYKLFNSQRDQLINVLGLTKLGIKTRSSVKEFNALTDITLDVPKGHRVGIIGRNGAGKTTLLKLICGNFSPTSGLIEVNGDVQALMSVGLGFHPEYTGRENAEASLQYNGLAREEYDAAIAGIIEFSELGQFLDQPFKSYSLGMQARLMFACATAIRPDILIVDEVLGAGDAYFVAKSKRRVESLVNSGCTMLLVSHSMQQVLELCSEAIWMEQGRIKMQGDAFLVVKAYESHLHGAPSSIPKVEATNSGLSGSDPKSTDNNDALRDLTFKKQMQDPYFLPNSEELKITKTVNPLDMKFIARGGLSRWDSEVGLKICGFSILDERGESNKLICLKPAQFVLHLVSECTELMSCRYGVVINDPMGRNVTVIFSPIDTFQAIQGELRRVEITFNPLQLGPGEYTVGISVHEATDLEYVNSSKRYDLLGRSFDFSVVLPDTLGVLHSQVLHSAEWGFHE
jgi:lipopolysaccharide transport system ATP-binding protein